MCFGGGGGKSSGGGGGSNRNNKARNTAAVGGLLGGPVGAAIGFVAGGGLKGLGGKGYRSNTGKGRNLDADWSVGHKSTRTALQTKRAGAQAEASDHNERLRTQNRNRVAAARTAQKPEAAKTGEEVKAEEDKLSLLDPSVKRALDVMMEGMDDEGKARLLASIYGIEGVFDKAPETTLSPPKREELYQRRPYIRWSQTRRNPFV